MNGDLNGKRKVSRFRIRQAVERRFRDGSIAEEAERYVAACREKKDDAGRGTGFPNLAGFCRWLKVGQGELREIGLRYPEAYDAMLTILEDEALCAVRGTSETARLMTVYLKRRLGYEDEVADAEPGALQVLFDHNILEDGK